MKFVLILIVALIALYVFWGRKYVKRAFPSFFAWLEPIEAKLWAKSRTVFAARLTWVGGLLAGVMNLTSGVDWTALLGQLTSHLPAGTQTTANALVVPVLISSLGGIFEWLRRVTTQPLDAKE